MDKLCRKGSRGGWKLVMYHAQDQPKPVQTERFLTSLNVFSTKTISYSVISYSLFGARLSVHVPASILRVIAEIAHI